MSFRPLLFKAYSKALKFVKLYDFPVDVISSVVDPDPHRSAFSWLPRIQSVSD